MSTAGAPPLEPRMRYRIRKASMGARGTSRLSGGAGPGPRYRITLQQVAIVGRGQGEHRGVRPGARASGGVHSHRDGRLFPGAAFAYDLLVGGRVVGELVDVVARPAQYRLGRRVRR